MNDVVRAITWDAPEHNHIEKGNDWYWALGIFAISASIAAFFFGNFLLSILIFAASFSMALLAIREPAIIPFSVSTRGLRIDDTLHTYNSLDVYCIDEENILGPQLLVRSKRLYMPLIIVPIPEEYIDEIEELVAERLPEEDLEEPFIHKLLEFFGF